jgi:hypothetical protein
MEPTTDNNLTGVVNQSSVMEGVRQEIHLGEVSIAHLGNGAEGTRYLARRTGRQATLAASGVVILKMTD